MRYEYHDDTHHSNKTAVLFHNDFVRCNGMYNVCVSLTDKTQKKEIAQSDRLCEYYYKSKSDCQHALLGRRFRLGGETSIG